MELGFGVENVTRSPVDSGLQGQGSVADGFTDHIVALFSPHWQYSLGTLACFGAALVKRQCGVLAKLPAMACKLTRADSKDFPPSFCIQALCSGLLPIFSAAKCPLALFGQQNLVLLETARL
jgi:hypothetical protein